MSGEKKGMIASIAAYIIFGLSYLFSKMALNVAEPIILLCLRFTVTFVLLNLLVVTRVLKLNLKGKNLAGPILLGVLQPVLYFILENYGLKYTTTSFTGMISALGPIFTTILGALILREMPNKKQWACICVSIAGVLMVSLKAGSGENTFLGCSCLIAAYFSGAFYSLLSRKLSGKFSAFELTYIMFTVGFVFFLGLAFFQNGSAALSQMADALRHSDFIIAVLYLGGLSSVGAYMLANYSLAKLPVARQSIFQNLSTVVSVLAGVIIMGDPFSAFSLIAFAMILVGVWGVNTFA
ncbi:MAG: DMT family transporter [Clostridia bacterium]|nr:DMT family transporter [Clostridia bacterium]